MCLVVNERSRKEGLSTVEYKCVFGHVLTSIVEVNIIGVWPLSGFQVVVHLPICLTVYMYVTLWLIVIYPHLITMSFVMTIQSFIDTTHFFRSDLLFMERTKVNMFWGLLRLIRCHYPLSTHQWTRTPQSSHCPFLMLRRISL